MRKADIIKRIVHQTGIESADVELIVDALLKNIKTEVSNGRRVDFRGFGAFLPKLRKPKKGRDICRNKMIEIPARIIASFKPSQKYFKIKEAINGV
jgi:nucleoid DNA-binding protein